jgi:hypothetical protein
VPVGPAALDVAADERGDYKVLVGELGSVGSGWWRLIIGPAPAARRAGSAVRRPGSRPRSRLVGVVGDDRLKFGHRHELALDDEAAALAGGWVIDEPHDAEDAPAVDDTLARADGVGGELDALVGPAGAACLGDGGHDGPPFQVALDP